MGELQVWSTIKCPDGRLRPLISCISCRRFRACRALSPAMIDALYASPTITVSPTRSGLVKRRYHMYLFQSTDGGIAPAPDGFDVKNPDYSSLRGVARILEVRCAYEPKIVLVRATEATSAATAGAADGKKVKRVSR